MEIAEKKRELIKKLKALEVREKTSVIKKPEDVVPVFLKFANRKQEYFLVCSLDGKHAVIKTRVVTIGLLNRTLVHPREIFTDALKDRAAAIIVGHNHPSGKVEPSAEDRDVTKRLKQAGDILGVPVLDHIIVSQEGFYSFLDKNEPSLF